MFDRVFFIYQSSLLVSIYFSTFVNAHRENLAVRHPCYSINKRLEPFIAWTEKLASSQYQAPKDTCGQIRSGPVCCTDEIVNSYASSLGIELKLLVDAELNRLSILVLSSKQQIEVWSKDFIQETETLTKTSLQTLFGSREFRSTIDASLRKLFETLEISRSSTDDVSRATVSLFHQLILALYRRFMNENERLIIDEKFQRCLINKAFDIEAFPNQRELLYTVSSGSSLIKSLRMMLIYIDADIQRLKSAATMTNNQCTERYAKETLCPICVSKQSEEKGESLCPNACRFLIRTCFNQTTNDYMAFASLAKGYSMIIKEIEQAVLELKLVERLSKLHIYLYDMIINATNSQQTYDQLQTACPHRTQKKFVRLRSLSPIVNERRESIHSWNSSLHFILHQLQSSIDNLHLRLPQQISAEICSNKNYVSTSSRCTQIDKQTQRGFLQWPISADSSVSSSWNYAELTRNQLNELKKKMTPIQEIIDSLKPKKKQSLIEYLPDFDTDETDGNGPEDLENQSALLVDDQENHIEESLSERLYKEIDEQTTTRRWTSVRPKLLENASRKSMEFHRLILFLIIIQQWPLINNR